MAARLRRSRARSATQPDDIVFVIDECLGGKLLRDALHAAGATTKLVKVEFGEGAADVDWLPKAGTRGWVVLTKDKAIRRRPIERGAFVQARVRAFFLVARNLTGPQVAELFASILPRMRSTVEQYEAPFIALVRREGIKMYEGDDCPAVRRKRPRAKRSRQGGDAS